MTTVNRFDRGEYRAPEKTPEGFLRVQGRLTRTGVFPYRKADGSIFYELRLPEEVFKEDSVRTFGLMPLTNDHPDVGYLTADNAKEYTVGSVGAPKQDGQFLESEILVTDASTVAMLERGEKRELSCGYACDLEMTPGVYQGARYDAIQRNIRANHVALVTRGRAGPEARVRMDSASAMQIDQPPEPQEPQMKMITMKFDGIDFEIPESAAQAVSKALKNSEDKAAAVQGELAKAQAKADTLENEVSTLKADIAAAPAKYKAEARARADLESKAREILGAEAKFDGKDDRTVKCEVIAKLAPSAKFDGKSDDYVQARFDMELDNASKNALSGARKDGVDAEVAPKNDEKAARERMIKENRNAWQK